MTTYLRQLSFINEPREHDVPTNRRRRCPINAGDATGGGGDDGCFVTRYLDGRMVTKPKEADTEIYHGKEPVNLPDWPLLCAPNTTRAPPLTAACTGPDDGLASIRRSRLHLSAGPDIDFIDTANDDDDQQERAAGDELAIRRSAQKAKAAQPRRSLPIADPNANPIGNGTAKPTKNVTISIVVSTISTNPDSSQMIKQIGILPSPPPNDNEPFCRAAAATAAVNGASQLLQGTLADERDWDGQGSAAVNWKLENDHAYGLSVSLYEKNCVTDERVGEPIADCYGLMVRGQSAVMAMADGVNWGEQYTTDCVMCNVIVNALIYLGEGARLAARSAVQGCLEYLDTAVLGHGAAGECLEMPKRVPHRPQTKMYYMIHTGGATETTRKVFVSLLRSFWEAHASILEVGGALSTLTAAVVLPLGSAALTTTDRHVVCACNVGDSFGYVYSKTHGVREFTQGSHDILNMRDMRDALGALGPVAGNQPELSNLTLSMTIVEPGDIVFLTSDGISDNFDPVVGKFAEPFTEARPMAAANGAVVPGLAPKRQNRSTSAIVSTSTTARSVRPISSSSAARPPLQPNAQRQPVQRSESHSHNRTRPALSIREPTAKPATTERPKFLRSHTVIEPRAAITHEVRRKLSTKLPLVTGQQRHALTLLRLDDLLCYGINGTHRPCPSARKLCHLLVDFAKMITVARRSLLEQRELYYRTVTDAVTGLRSEVELNKLQQRAARKRVVDGSTFGQLPGKLDHASVVAFTVESTGAHRSASSLASSRPPPTGGRTSIVETNL